MLMPRERAACVTMPVIARLATEPEAAAGLPALQVGRDRIAPRRGMEIGGEGEQRIVVLRGWRNMGGVEAQRRRHERATAEVAWRAILQIGWIMAPRKEQVLAG